MKKCVIELVSNLVHAFNPIECRLQSIEWEKEDPFSEEPGAVVSGYIHQIQTYYWHTETGNNYLAFNGGAVWPFLKTPGALVVIGILMPDQAEDIPILEVMEAALVGSQRELLEMIRDLRKKYGARKNSDILDIWHGQTPTTDQIADLMRFQAEAEGVPHDRGESRFWFSEPYQLKEPDFYRNTVQSIIECLRTGQKRLTGLSGFGTLQGELSNLTAEDLRGRIENFPAVAALCLAFTGINPSFGQAGTWERVIVQNIKSGDTFGI